MLCLIKFIGRYFKDDKLVENHQFLIDKLNKVYETNIILLNFVDYLFASIVSVCYYCKKHYVVVNINLYFCCTVIPKGARGFYLRMFILYILCTLFSETVKAR